MSKIKLWITVVSITAMLALIVGCSGNNANSSSSSEAPGSSTAPAASEPAKPSAKAAPVHLKVEVFDRNNLKNGETANKNKWTEWIRERVLEELNIDVEFVPVPRSQEVDKLNVLMATGDAPDIVFTYNQNVVFSYAKDGGLLDVSELLKEHGQELTKYLGDEVLAYGEIFGKQYAIPAKRAFLGDASALIRKDWLDKLNLPVPATTEQFLETLRAFKERDPGGLGSKTIPYGTIAFDGSYNVNSRLLLQSFIQRDDEETFYTNYEFMMPGFKDGAKFFNTLYNEGLMSKDFPLDKDGKKFESDFTNGYIGAISQTGIHVFDSGLMDMLQKNVPEAEFIAMDAFTDRNGNHPKEIYSAMDKYILIPKTSKNAVAAVQYLNWMANMDNLTMLVNGIEGEDHKLVEGTAVAIIDPDRPNNRFDLSIITNGIDYGSDAENIKSLVMNKTPQYAELATSLLNTSLVDGYSKPRFDRPIDAEIKYSSLLDDKKDEILTKAATAKPADFDAVYDSGAAEWLATGGQEVLDGRNKAYKEMKAGQ